jgi:NADPH:quinone reductase
MKLHIYLSLIKTSQNEAVGLYKHLPIENPQSLVDLDIQQPKHPTGHDLLVAIKAILVNSLDTKVRRGTIPPSENENMPRILGCCWRSNSRWFRL